MYERYEYGHYVFCVASSFYLRSLVASVFMNEHGGIYYAGNKVEKGNSVRMVTTCVLLLFSK